MAKWIDFQPRQDAKWSHVEYFVEKYKRILQYDDYKVEKLFEKFNDFKFFSDSELSAAVWEVAIVREYDDGWKEYRISTLWYHHIQQLRSLVGNKQRSELMFRIAKLILVTPNSNTGIERLFSLIKKNKSASSDRNRLDIEGSLSSTCAVKTERPSEKHLNSAKKAT